jgi:hypothetical protein
MKKLRIIWLILVVVCLAFTSCENEKDVQSDIDRLRSERTLLERDVEGLQYEILSREKEISVLNDELKELNIYKIGKTPKYLLKIRLKQTHYTLDIGEHIKDGMNSVEFEIPVDKEYYNSVSRGCDIVDNFRVGSLILNGSFGSWDMSVADKKIVY